MPFTSRSSLTAGLVVAVAFLAASGCAGKQQPAAAEPSIDPRTAVALPADAQQAVLHEMRQMLGAIGGAMDAAVKGDTAALLAAVAPAGSAAAADPAIEALLPAQWKELAERVHFGFDTLAAEVRQARGKQALKDAVLARLVKLTGSCTACHETYRVTVNHGP